MPDSVRGILFLCVANSARSQMAEGIGRTLAPAGVQVFSAGSNPGTLHPMAVQVLAEIGIDIRHHRSKPVAAVPRELVQLVITLCAEEVCPAWFGDGGRLHWPLEDPAAAPPEHLQRSFRTVRDQLVQRLQNLFGKELNP
jgi:arsenate reductase